MITLNTIPTVMSCQFSRQAFVDVAPQRSASLSFAFSVPIPARRAGTSVERHDPRRVRSPSGHRALLPSVPRQQGQAPTSAPASLAPSISRTSVLLAPEVLRRLLLDDCTCFVTRFKHVSHVGVPCCGAPREWGPAACHPCPVLILGQEVAQGRQGSEGSTHLAGGFEDEVGSSLPVARSSAHVTHSPRRRLRVRAPP